MDQSKIMSVTTEAIDQLEPGERPHTLEEYSFDHFRLVKCIHISDINAELCVYVTAWSFLYKHLISGYFIISAMKYSFINQHSSHLLCCRAPPKRTLSKTLTLPSARKRRQDDLWRYSKEAIKQPLLKKLIGKDELSQLACMCFLDILCLVFWSKFNCFVSNVINDNHITVSDVCTCNKIAFHLLKA